MGAGSSLQLSAPRDMTSSDLAAAIYQDLGVPEGDMCSDELVFQAKSWFDQQPTVQPESWIRSIIDQHQDGQGNVSQHEFAYAIDRLKQC